MRTSRRTGSRLIWDGPLFGPAGKPVCGPSRQSPSAGDREQRNGRAYCSYGEVNGEPRRNDFWPWVAWARRTPAVARLESRVSVALKAKLFRVRGMGNARRMLEPRPVVRASDPMRLHRVLPDTFFA